MLMDPLPHIIKVYSLLIVKDCIPTHLFKLGKACMNEWSHIGVSQNDSSTDYICPLR